MLSIRLLPFLLAAVTPEARAPWTDGNWMQRSSFDGRLHQWPGAHVSLRA